MTIHIAVPTKAKAQLETALVHYRKAIVDLNTAIEVGAWGKVHALQGSRDLQAHTIAVIVNSCTLTLAGERMPA
jgi:hypothetical protein